jgi:hypothetical protein
MLVAKAASWLQSLWWATEKSPWGPWIASVIFRKPKSQQAGGRVAGQAQQQQRWSSVRSAVLLFNNVWVTLVTAV